MMVLLSLILTANYYFYDAISPLKEELMQMLDITNSQYGFAMGIYSLPNIILCIVGGILLDKLGIRLSGVVYIAFMVIGALITYFATTEAGIATGYSFHLLCGGFLLFGIGAETSSLVINKAIIKWFKGKEIALALGLNVSFGRLGTGIAFVLPTRLMGIEWNAGIGVGALAVTVALFLFFVYNFYDKKLDKDLDDPTAEVDPEDEFKFSDLKKLITDPSFLFITLLCVTFYSAVFPFLKFAPDLMTNKFGMSKELSGDIVSFLPFGTILFTPLFGWVCDKYGKSAKLMIMGSILLIVSHLLFAFTTVTAGIPVFLLGVAFALVPAAMWPSVAKIVRESQQGTAYGIMFAIQNIGLTLFPMLIGFVLDSTNVGVAEGGVLDYTYAIGMLSLLGVIGLVFSFLLLRADSRNGSILEAPNMVQE
jgi:nitrate/nitrite transporter NarK